MQESVGLAFVAFVFVFGEVVGAATAVESDALLLPPPPHPPPPPPHPAGPLQQHGRERVGRRPAHAEGVGRKARDDDPPFPPPPPIMIGGEGTADDVRGALREDHAKRVDGRVHLTPGA